MRHWIIETCWMNKGRNIGLKKYYEAIKEACKGKDGVEFLGLYRPLNEGWNWAYFLKTDNLDKWRELDKEINRLYTDINYNVTSTVTRIYEGSDQLKQPPIPKNRDNLNYLFIDFNIFTGIITGLQEYYSEQCELFEGVEDEWFLGLYSPWTDEWNWAFLYMIDSLGRFYDLNHEFYKSHPRPESITLSIQRIYERFEP